MDELITFEIPADRDAYRALDADALDKLERDAYAAVDKLREKGASAFTATDVSGLERLHEVVTTVRAERAERETNATRAGELLGELTPAETGDSETTTETEAETPADAPTEGEKESALVASGKGGARTAPRVGDVAKNAPRPTPPNTSDIEEFAAVVLGENARGKRFETWLDVAKAAEERFSQYTGMTGPGRHTVATVKRQFAADLVADESNADEVMARAADESRLPGGSLVAAAGWCAPSQTIYDLLELETGDGMFDLPEINVSRGGIRYTPGPDFSSIFAGTGYFHQTEAQVIANTTKPCMEIPCPAFVDVRLDVDGICITGSLLQRRGYPEMVERFIRGALVAHAHKINAWVIDKVATGSTAVDLTTGGVGTVNDTTTTGLLAAVELAIEDTRYRHRMAQNATAEVVLPHWVLPQIRADLSRRTGVDMLNVTDAQIRAHFALRGARVQFPYDWQDAYSGLATGPGGATPIAALPTEVKFMVYPAGTWVRGSEDVIRLDTIYDSTNLSTNRYTALFSEEGILVAKRGHDSRIYTATLCPSGATGAAVEYACAAA